MATDETKVKPAPDITGAKAKKREPGFNAEGKAYPGVDPDTGERKAITWVGAREEFGERAGSQLYNALAVAAFGGVQPGRPALSLMTLGSQYLRPRKRNAAGLFTETETEYARAAEKFKARGEKVTKLLADAEAEASKGV